MFKENDDGSKKVYLAYPEHLKRCNRAGFPFPNTHSPSNIYLIFYNL